MKQLHTIGLILSLALQATAQAASSPAEKSLHVSKQAGKVFRCSRDIIKTLQTDEADLLTVSELLQNATLELDLDQSLERCQARKAVVAQKSQMTQEQVLAKSAVLVKDKIITPGIGTAMGMMLSNARVTCEIGEINADAILGIGLGIGLGAGKCVTDDGHATIAFVPSVENGEGLYFGMTGGEDNLTENQKNQKPDYKTAIGLGVAILLHDNQNSDEVGVGGGFANLTVHFGILKVLPIGNDFRNLKKTILL